MTTRLRLLVISVVPLQLLLLFHLSPYSLPSSDTPLVRGSTSSSTAGWGVALYDGSATRKSSKQRMTLIVGGFQKTGTTAMSAILSENPQIAFASKKELHFFDKSRYNPFLEAEKSSSPISPILAPLPKVVATDHHGLPLSPRPLSNSLLSAPFVNSNPKIPNSYDTFWPAMPRLEEGTPPILDSGSSGSSVFPGGVSRTKPTFLSHGIRAEATPFYLASPSTCPALSAFLSDSALESLESEPKTKAAATRHIDVESVHCLNMKLHWRQTA